MTAEQRPRLTAAFRTDPGRDPSKQVNEDAVAYEETAVGTLAIVCDGMGGHARGAEASQLAIRTVVEQLRAVDRAAHPGASLKAAVEEAGRRVHALGQPTDRARPGSTLVALLFHTGGTEVAHCGDSRAYVLRRGQLHPLTRDHSLVREMVELGQLRPEDAVGHPDSNKITRALGLRPDCAVELRAAAFHQETHDVFLLTSDGITDVIGDADLQALAETGLTEGMDALAGRSVHIANARGGPDNTTLLAVHVDDPGLVPDRVAARAAHLVETAARGATQPGDTVTDEIFDAPVGSPPGLSGKGATQVLRTDEVPRPGPSGPVVTSPATSGQHAPLPAKAGAAKGGTAKLAVHANANDAVAGVAPTRGKRLYVGLGLMLVGVVLMVVSAVAMNEPDEAPPPLLEAPAPGKSGLRSGPAGAYARTGDQPARAKVAASPASCASACGARAT